jgi:hypothetical protein
LGRASGKSGVRLDVSEIVVGIGGKVYVRVGARGDIRVVSKLKILFRLDHI